MTQPVHAEISLIRERRNKSKKTTKGHWLKVYVPDALYDRCEALKARLATVAPHLALNHKSLIMRQALEEAVTRAERSLAMMEREAEAAPRPAAGAPERDGGRAHV